MSVSRCCLWQGANLTIRQSAAGRIRRAWSAAQKTPCLLVHLEAWRVYYHLARPHESLRVELAVSIERRGNRTPQRYRQRTPAMAAGLTTRLWKVRELLALPMMPDRIASIGSVTETSPVAS